MKMAALLIALWMISVAGSWGQTMNVRVRPVQLRQSPLPGIQFLCSTNYPTDSCVRDTRALVGELSRLPAVSLGQWSFLLVPSGDWNAVMAELRHEPGSPAFSLLSQRITVLESSLFQPPPASAGALMETFGTLGETLLRRAITHELAHGICGEKDEYRTEQEAEKLRQGLSLSCGVTTVMRGGK